jgi:hypothetical protein
VVGFGWGLKMNVFNSYVKVKLDMSLFKYGFREGEKIQGNSPCNKGTVIQIIRGSYPTFTRMEDFELDSLTVPYFSHMSRDERREWFDLNHTQNNDLYFEDVDPEVTVKFLTLGGKFIEELPEEVKEEFMSREMTFREAYTLIPKRNESKALKHTLIFRPSIWSLKSNGKSVSHKGVVINADDGTIHSVDEEMLVYSVVDRSIGLYSSGEGVKVSFEELCHLLDVQVNGEIVSLISWFPPSMHKSLMQKLIRTSCIRVEHEGRLFDAEEVLKITFCMLLTSSGSFVPDIQRYVTGVEGLAKRLAVSIAEDSYISEGHYESFLSMISCSGVAQDDASWFPELGTIKMWLDTAITSQKDMRKFHYEWRTFDERALSISEGVNPTLKASYYVLKDVKTFHSDIALVGCIALQGGKHTLREGSKRMEVMPLVHSLCHHSFPEVAHYASIDLIWECDHYSKFFSSVWNDVIGWNARTSLNDKGPEGEFFEGYDIARRLLWDLRSNVGQCLRRETGEVVEIFSSMTAAEFAGWVGPIEVSLKGRITSVVVLSDSDLGNFIPFKKPSRGEKNPTLTEQQKNESREAVMREFIQGLRVKGKLVKLQDGTFYVDGRPYDRGEVKYLKVVEEIESSLNCSVHTYHETGVEREYERKVKDIVSQLNPTLKNRLLSYLTPYPEGWEIELHRISKDGNGTEYAVHPKDTVINHVLGMFSCIFPAALRKVTKGYKIHCKEAYSLLLSCLRDVEDNPIEGDLGLPTTLLEDASVRELYEHQKDSVEELMSRRDRGLRKHIIWIEVGKGKTSICIEYMRRIKMPKYCVYTLPNTSIDNIVKEFALYGIQCNLLSGLKDSRNYTPLEGVVNLLPHDHARTERISSFLREHSSDIFLVVDELHKALAKTKRTSILLEIASTCNECIAMTGTIVKDQEYDELIAWLKLVVEFEVTIKNYQVAIGSLISRSMELPIEEVRTPIEAEMLDSEGYFSCLPTSMGGTARHIDFRGALSYCYDSVNEMIVRIAKYHLDEVGEGVFIVARDKRSQGILAEMLNEYPTHIITKDTPITLGPDYDGPLRVVITTQSQCEGYTLTAFHVMITSVYLSNGATREQVEGRLKRLGQKSTYVQLYTVHCGILSNILHRYENVRSIAAALKGLAKEISPGMTLTDL